jgi:hypothetical protein
MRHFAVFCIHFDLEAITILTQPGWFRSHRRALHVISRIRSLTLTGRIIGILAISQTLGFKSISRLDLFASTIIRSNPTPAVRTTSDRGFWKARRMVIRGRLLIRVRRTNLSHHRTPFARFQSIPPSISVAFEFVKRAKPVMAKITLS